MASVDELYIEITAKAVKANDSIDRLSQKLNQLSTSLSHLNSSSLIGLANGVQRLSTSMQGMKSIGTADFTRLTRNLNNIGTVNTTSLNRLASATTQIGKSFNRLSGASSGIKAMGDLANGIKQLGYASSTKAITNIPQLATALKGMMTTLSTAPRVSRNLINMTNALARLSRTGGMAGTTANSLVRSFNRMPSATSRASKGFTSLAATIGKVYATYWLLFRAFGKISQAMTLASNLTEVENVINHTFGALRTKLDAFTKDSIEKFGMAELAAKQYAGRFQAMGKAMGISNNAVAQSTEFLNGKLGKNAKIYGDLGNSMADMSVNLTKLTSDYASFFDVAQSDVAEDFQSIFTGQTKPLRTYGLDLTQATLKEYALANGLNANINAMSQAEKAMLRYQYVMANSSHIMGDFARTSDTWHNTTVRLKNNFQMLGTTVGKAFINLLKPVAVFVNNAIVGLNKVAIAISNALGKLLGWEYEAGSGGMTTDYEDAAEYADDMASGTGKAAKAAKELKKQLQGIDELNVLTTDKDNGNGGGSGGGAGAVGAGGTTGQDGSWVKTSGMFDWDGETWRDLGRQIGDGLKKAMDNIKWDEIYQKAAKFGTGLAEFLNGLFEGEKGNTLFGKVGKTIAGALNTSLQFLYNFAKTFDWTQFGVNLADGINQFFTNFDFKMLAQTLNKWVDGLWDFIGSVIKNTDKKAILNGFKDFLGNLELDTVLTIGGFIAFKTGLASKIASGIFTSISTSVASKFGNGQLATMIATAMGFSDASSLGIALGTRLAQLGILVGVAIVGYKIGGKIYEKLTGEQAQGGLKDLIDMGVSWSEIGQAISDGAIVDITLTPLLQWGSGDKTITTQEVIDAGSKMIEDVVNGIKNLPQKVLSVSLDLGAKLTGTTLTEEQKQQVQNAFSKLPSVAVNTIANFTGWKKGESFISNVGNMVVKFNSWILDASFGKTIGGMIASFVSWVLDETSFGKTVSGMIAKFTGHDEDTKGGFKKTIGGMVANLVDKKKDNNFDSVIGKMTAKITSIQDKRKDKDKKLAFQATIKKDSIPSSVREAWKKAGFTLTANGGAFYQGSWHDIPQYSAGGFPNHGSVFVAGEAGAEVVGHVNGRTEVLNESQMARTMYNSVLSANAEQNALLRQQNQLLTQILQKETGISYKDVFRATQKGAKEYTQMTGNYAF